MELGANDRFGYKHLPLYWSEPDRHPFLIKVDGRLAGLALVKRGSGVSDSQVVWDVGEFFIVRAYRRQGIRMKVAHEVRGGLRKVHNRADNVFDCSPYCLMEPWPPSRQTLQMPNPLPFA